MLIHQTKIINKDIFEKIIKIFQIECHNDINNFENFLDLLIVESKNNKRIEILTLLLIYYKSDEIFELKDQRFKIIKLIKENKFLFENFKLNEKDNDKIVFDKICDKLRIHDDKFKEIAENLTMINDLVVNKSIILKELSNKFVQYLLNNIDYNKQLNKIFFLKFFNKLEEINNSNEFNKIALSDNLIYDISILEKEKFLCPYIIIHLLKLINNVNVEICSLLESKDEYRTTELDLRIENRKYPFEPDANIELLFELTNAGNSSADAIKFILNTDSSFDLINEVEIFNLEPKENKTVIFSGNCSNEIKKSNSINAEIKLEWMNYDGSKGYIEKLVEFVGQSLDIEWDNLKKKRPYRIEEIKKEKDLFGRDEEIEEVLYDIVDLQNYIIYGQKRIGKTSFAKVLQDKIMDEVDVHPLYFITSDYSKTDSNIFLKQFGEHIISSISRSLLKELDFKDDLFNNSLDYLIKYFKTLEIENKNNKFILFIDEFDELPIDILNDVSISDGFFHNLRSLSNKNNVGIVLVGGENMDEIMKFTDRLNNFKPYRLETIRKQFSKDYFNLVQNPAPELNYEDKVLENLYRITNGNAFFTKYICSEIWKNALRKRDLHINMRLFNSVLNDVTESIEVNQLNHFWLDKTPINSNESYKSKLRFDRRNFLRSFVYNIKNEKKQIFENNIIVEEFISRKILEINSDKEYKILPPLFEKWLIESGINKLNNSYQDDITIKDYENKELKYYIDDREINRFLEDKKITYQASEINLETIKSWLNNFNDNKTKRVFFNLLKNIKFYSHRDLLDKFEIIFSSVITKKDKLHQGDILVSAFGGPSKSGMHLMKPFATKNKIYVDNCMYISEIEKINLKRFSKIFFIEDIIATGSQMKNYLKELLEENENIRNFSETPGKEIVIGSIVANQEETDKIMKKYNKNNINFVYVDAIEKFDNYFEFLKKDNFDIEESEIVIKEKCREIENKQPYGYGNMSLLYVFYYNCPNNSLPILWKKASNYIPLFKRN